MKHKMTRWMDWLSIIWTIAAKDIQEAIKYNLVLGLIATMSILLLLPKMISWAIDPPYVDLPVYDLGKSHLVAELEASPQFRVQKAHSIPELNSYLVNSIEPKLGLVIPIEFNDKFEAGERPEVEGYVSWGNRHKVEEMKTNLEDQLSELLGQPVFIQVDDNLVFPPQNSGLILGLLTLNALTVTILMGITLVPNLMFEEKRTRTFEALMVSPAGVSQIVIGKALSGLFYIVVTCCVMFAFYWRSVVHWEMVPLFIFGVGFFSIAIGLVLGTFFDRQLEVTGLTMLLIGLLIGALFIELLHLDIPHFFEILISWVPSVPLAEIFNFSFLEESSTRHLWINLLKVTMVSLPLYALVIWKVRRQE